MSADVDTSWSTSGYVMTYAGGAVSWQLRLQKTVALSTTEAEYMAAVEKSYRYKYDLGHTIVMCCCIIVSIDVHSVRERERGRCLTM